MMRFLVGVARNKVAVQGVGDESTMRIANANRQIVSSQTITKLGSSKVGISTSPSRPRVA